MTAILVSDITENNGKTVRENNMDKGHHLPLLSAVTIVQSDDDECWLEDKSTEIKHVVTHGLPLYVVKHARDCDGTPIYALSLLPSVIPDEVWITDYYRQNILKDPTSTNQVIGVANHITGFILTGMPEGSLSPLN